MSRVCPKLAYVAHPLACVPPRGEHDGDELPSWGRTHAAEPCQVYGQWWLRVSSTRSARARFSLALSPGFVVHLSRAFTSWKTARCNEKANCLACGMYAGPV